MIDEILNQILSQILPCSPAPFEGKETEYLAWTYNEIPAVIAEGVPDVVRYLINITYVLPRNKNGMATRRRICKDLLAAGFTSPSTQNIGDETAQAWAIETEFEEAF